MTLKNHRRRQISVMTASRCRASAEQDLKSRGACATLFFFCVPAQEKKQDFSVGLSARLCLVGSCRTTPHCILQLSTENKANMLLHSLKKKNPIDTKLDSKFSEPDPSVGSAQTQCERLKHQMLIEMHAGWNTEFHCYMAATHRHRGTFYLEFVYSVSV